MNYRHTFHAGNFADVLKHAALVAVILHLKKKDTAFAVLDTHAGRGIYDLGSAEAAKTGEAAGAIGRLLASPDIPGVLAPYLEIVRSFGEGRYPGSSLIAATLLRPQDRLVAVEFQPSECEVLAHNLRPFGNAKAILGDGYRELPSLLPPRERRGVALIDPPYEDANEFSHATAELVAAHRRFATGIYLLWYPAKALPLVEATVAELLNAGIKSLVRLELDVGKAMTPEREGRGPPMRATGLLVINPPFGFTRDFEAILSFLVRELAQGPDASSHLETLAER